MRPLYISGARRAAAGDAARDVINPHSATVVASVAEAAPEDARKAVAAARRAVDQGPWPHTQAAERGRMVRALGQVIETHAEDLAWLETLDTAKPLPDSRQDMRDIVATFRYFGGAVEALAGRVVDAGAGIASQVVREPVGVCAAITPWNYPLLQAAWKIAPALAAGNAIVVKPSELTPLSTHRLVELAHDELDLPEGVLNLVLGPGEPVGSELTTHPDVDMVSFTGGLATGRRIMAAAAATVKKVALELGGKNPNIVCGDADLDVAADHTLTAAFLHSGQVCSAGARLIVEGSVHDALVQRLVGRLGEIRLGDGRVAGVKAGPLISAEHRAKVESYIRLAQEEGARLVAGGGRPPDPELADGFYVQPTVFVDCTAQMRVVQEEVFGPVLTVERFRSDDEAVALANGTAYGLAGGVFSGDSARARRLASRLRIGTVWVNDFHPYIPQAEWGGVKQSGTGRELGQDGLLEYTETKHVYENLHPGRSGWL